MKSIFLGLFLSALSLTDLQGATQLTTRTFTASEPGFLVNSTLIAGAKECILIDAQFLEADIKNVIKEISASGCNLSTVYITHGHPDHYFGLAAIAEAFPAVQVLAKAGVVSEIAKTAEGKLAYWKTVYPAGALTSKLITPNVFEADEILLEGNRIEIIDFGNTENESSTAFFIPSLKTLVSGDLVYNQVHLWLADDNLNLATWKDSLKFIESRFSIETISPGHGPVGGRGLIADNIRYLDQFKKSISTAQNAKDTQALTEELYPNFKLPIIARLSSEKAFSARK